jgi:hypothetical protein
VRCCALSRAVPDAYLHFVSFTALLPAGSPFGRVALQQALHCCANLSMQGRNVAAVSTVPSASSLSAATRCGKSASTAQVASPVGILPSPTSLSVSVCDTPTSAIVRPPLPGSAASFPAGPPASTTPEPPLPAGATKASVPTTTQQPSSAAPGSGDDSKGWRAFFLPSSAL